MGWFFIVMDWIIPSFPQGPYVLAPAFRISLQSQTWKVSDINGPSKNHSKRSNYLRLHQIIMWFWGISVYQDHWIGRTHFSWVLVGSSRHKSMAEQTRKRDMTRSWFHADCGFETEICTTPKWLVAWKAQELGGTLLGPIHGGLKVAAQRRKTQKNKLHIFIECWKNYETPTNIKHAW